MTPPSGMQWTSEVLGETEAKGSHGPALDAWAKKRAESAFAMLENFCPEGTIIVSLHHMHPPIQEWDEEESV